MGKNKTVKIDPFLSKVICYAKHIIACDKDGRVPYIFTARQDGIKRKAFELARNNN